MIEFICNGPESIPEGRKQAAQDVISSLTFDERVSMQIILKNMLQLDINETEAFADQPEEQV